MIELINSERLWARVNHLAQMTLPDLSKPTTTGCRRSLSRKQEPPPTLRGCLFLKKPTGAAKNPTPIYLTGA